MAESSEIGKGDTGGWATVAKSKKRSSGNYNRQQSPQQQSSSWLPSPSSTPLTIAPIPPTACNTTFEPFLLLLMGLPGSGKSTLANALEQAMPYKFVRINQDQLGTRKKCESKLNAVLDKNTTESSMRCPVIDRCNFDELQRSTWCAMAEAFRTHHKNVVLLPIHLVVLDVPAPECLRRCEQRQNHETLQKSQAWSVIRMVQQQWQLPSQNEQKRYRSMTIVKSQADMEQCFLRLLHS